MKRAHLTLEEGLRFRARTHAGFELTLDSRVAGEQAAGASPMEIQLVALAACTAMDVISILRKMHQDVTAYDVDATAEQRPEHPRAFTTAVVTHTFRGNGLREDNVRRAIALTITRYCPVYAMLSPSVAIEERYVIEDAAGAIVASGQVAPLPPEPSESS